METKKISSAVISVVGTTTGALSSRVVADALPIDNAKLKHGAFAVVGIVGAALLNRKNATSAFAQDVAIGVSATQIGYLAKEIMGETTGALKTALGNPFQQKDQVFLSSYNDRYDFIPTDENEPKALTFRS